MGYYVGLRGSQEHVDLMMANIVKTSQFTQEHGPDLCGLKYSGVQVPFHKMKQLKLGSTTMSAEQEQLFSIPEDPFNDIFCPYTILQFYFSRCHPSATKLYAQVLTPKQREEWKQEHGTDVWYHASGVGCSNYNLGKTTLAKKHKELARICGVDDWEKVTGHALRTLIINTMKVAGRNPMEIANAVRQKNPNAQMVYNRSMVESEATKANALRPKAGRRNHFNMTTGDPMSPPQKRQAVPKIPDRPSSKERMQAEIDSLKLAIQSQQQPVPPPGPFPHQHHQNQFFNPMAAMGMNMMNPMMMNPFMNMQAQKAAMYGGGMMPFQHQQLGGGGIGFQLPHGQHQVNTLPVQNSNAFQNMQPPAFNPAQTGHIPTPQYPSDQQQHVPLYYQQPNGYHPPNDGRYY